MRGDVHKHIIDLIITIIVLFIYILIYLIVAFVRTRWMNKYKNECWPIRTIPNSESALFYQLVLHRTNEIAKSTTHTSNCVISGSCKKQTKL